MAKLKVKKFVGYTEEDSSFITILTEGTERPESIGDSAWCSPDCSEVEVAEWIEGKNLKEFLSWFENEKSVKGFLRRLGVDVD